MNVIILRYSGFSQVNEKGNIILITSKSRFSEITDDGELFVMLKSFDV